MKHVIPTLALLCACPAFAEESRQLDAHEHGVGTLNIAIEGNTVEMAFEAPGADIVGFEYEAETDTDRAAVEAAVATLGAPLDLFVMPDAANCTVVKAEAELEGEHEHDEGHDDHGEDDHDDHAEEAGHTEFHAEYTLTCDAPDALSEITFAYFDAFPNAKEVELQLITTTGAQAYEVERDAPVLQMER